MMLPPPLNTLQVNGLTTGYRHRRVIHDLTLPAVEAGQVIALVGPNAAGKSTLLRALAGLLPATGSVRLGDRDVLNLPLAERAEHVAFMPQALPQGVALSVLESVMSALKATSGWSGARSARARALNVLDRVGMTDRALDPLDQLSGGQRQLVGLAQAIVREPVLLLLDEPTSALDLRHQVTVMQLLRAIAADGRVVVVVLHDLNLAARWAQHVVVLHQGALCVAGPPERALTPGVLAQVYGVDARVERCSRHGLQVLVDQALDNPEEPNG